MDGQVSHQVKGKAKRETIIENEYSRCMGKAVRKRILIMAFVFHRPHYLR